MTANQLVAYNLRRARLKSDLTQDQAAQRLEPYLGKKWSKAVFSAAETSVTSGRVREFSADEILAFAAAFDLPVSWFFLPPHESDLREAVSMGGTSQLTSAAVIDAAVPAASGGNELTERLVELAKALPTKELPNLEKRAAGALANRLSAALLASVGDVLAEADHLRRVADLLAAAPARVIEQTLDDLTPGRRLARAAGAKEDKKDG